MENNNRIPNQYEEDLKKLNNAINRVKNYIIFTKDDTKIEEKKKKISYLFANFMVQNFRKGTNPTYLIDITSKIIEQHPGFTFEIITAFTQSYISKGKTLENIGKSIFQIIKNNEREKNPLLVPFSVYGFVKACLMRRPDDTDDMTKGFSNLLNGTGYEKEYNLKEIIKEYYDLYEINLEKLEKEIGNIIKNAKIADDKKREKINNAKILDGKNREKINNAFFNFILYNIQEQKEPKLLIETASKIIINNPELAFAIIDAFTQGFIRKGKNLKYISAGISEIIKKDKIIEIDRARSKLGLVYNIARAFTQDYIIFKQRWEDIGAHISYIINNEEIKKYPRLVFMIIDGFTQGCIMQNKNLTDISVRISDIINTTVIKNNQNLASDIIAGFTQGCIFQNQNWENIGKGISNILNDKEIKGDSDLVCNIIDTFVKGCLTLRPYNIKEIAEIFSKLLDIDFGTNETKIKSKLESTLSSIENQHRTNTFTNSSNKQLSREYIEYKKQTETQLFYCRKKLSNERNNGKITNSCYDSPQPSCPSTNSSKNGKGTIRKPSTEALNSRKRGYDNAPDSEEKNNSHSSKRLKQQNTTEKDKSCCVI